jgi:hypothetical protein
MVAALNEFDRVLRIVSLEERAWGVFIRAMKSRDTRARTITIKRARWQRINALRGESVSRYRQHAFETYLQSMGCKT